MCGPPIKPKYIAASVWGGDNGPNYQPKRPSQKQSSKQCKSYQHSVLHWASQAAPNLPPPLPDSLHRMCAQLLQQTPTHQSMKRPCSSSP